MRTSHLGPNEAHFDGLSNPSPCDSDRLTLYISYEEASPKTKRRCPQPAPYRYSLADADDAMLCLGRGMAPEMHVDEDLCMVVWGSSLAIRFPTIEDQRIFTSRLRRITITHQSLAFHPTASQLNTALEQPIPRATLTTPALTSTATESLSNDKRHNLADIGSDAESPPPKRASPTVLVAGTTGLVEAALW